ncbi:MAG TPA: efflux RND transporter periplasmic adaptor subunit [Bacillota bacterium]|nr:efflux RND transporter periplasmic adaptor subunit [Bacillota bacterium]
MNGNRKKIMIAIVALMVVVVAGIVVYYGVNSMLYVKTEDAKVAGDIVKVSSQISGKLLELNTDEGDTVEKDQIIGRQEMGSLGDSAIEQSLLRAPISGFIIKKQSNPGEMLTASQTVVMMIDPKQLYITANVEETDLAKLKVGQTVDISIDEYKGEKLHGKIQSIGKAANSAFSLLSGSSSSTFTKVVQKVPVKIAFENKESSAGLLLGTNAVVKIHIK